MKLQFLSAQNQHIPLIFAQAKNLIDTYEDVSAIEYDKVLNWVEKKITTHISEYVCVLLNGQACGFYRLCEDGELDDLYVLPAFQNRGIGSEIMKRCIAVSDHPIYLYVFRRNTRAVAFYERFGFCVRETVCNTRYIMALKG